MFTFQKEPSFFQSPVIKIFPLKIPEKMSAQNANTYCKDRMLTKQYN